MKGGALETIRPLRADSDSYAAFSHVFITSFTGGKCYEPSYDALESVAVDSSPAVTEGRGNKHTLRDWLTTSLASSTISSATAAAQTPLDTNDDQKDGGVSTWEKGSSSELGKSYWFRSLALKTTGPGWWGAPEERGSTFCFFSYFLFCRGTSVLSG